MATESKSKAEFHQKVTRSLTPEEYKLVCLGYVRNNITNAVEDVATILLKFVLHTFVHWKWDYFKTWKKDKSVLKYITDDDKTYTSNESGKAVFGRCNFAMLPNSGLYEIKFKINRIGGMDVYTNIGVTTNLDDNNNTTKDEWWYYSQEYVGWCAAQKISTHEKQYRPYNLMCGGWAEQENNIFYKQMKYSDYNENGKLPSYAKNDILTFKYNSDENWLQFEKNEQNLNEKITNLPKDKTFYWIAGGFSCDLSITVLN